MSLLKHVVISDGTGDVDMEDDFDIDADFKQMSIGNRTLDNRDAMPLPMSMNNDLNPS